MGFQEAFLQFIHRCHGLSPKGELHLWARSLYWMLSFLLEAIRFLKGRHARMPEDVRAEYERYAHHGVLDKQQRRVLGFRSGKLVLITEREARVNLWRELFPHVMQYLGVSHSILEIGCGDMVNARVLRGEWNLPCSFVGADFSFNRVRLAVLNGERAVVADARLLPFPDKTFDLVVTMHFLEQVNPILSEVLKEMRRVAKRVVLAIEPHYEGANWVQKLRMNHLNYLRSLVPMAEKQGLCQFLQHKLHSCDTAINRPTAFLFYVQETQISGSKP